MEQILKAEFHFKPDILKLNITEPCILTNNPELV